MTDPTDRLLGELVDDLRPVRRLPPPGAVFGAVLLLSAAVLALALLLTGHALAIGALLHDEVYLVSFFGLAMAGLGGALAALAGALPGRERLERAARTTAWVGLGVAAIACVGGLGERPVDRVIAATGYSGTCFRYGMILSLPPGLVLARYLVRGWALRPIRSAALTLVGAGALGALVTHLGCGLVWPGHVLLGHLGVPVALALVGGTPLAFWLRRRGG